MKLNPPASSSDLEAARQIARRLHQSRRRDDRSASSATAEEMPARPRLTPPPLPARPAAAPEPPERPSMRTESRPAPRPAPPPPPPPEPDDIEVDVEPEAPSWRGPTFSPAEPEPLEDMVSPPASRFAPAIEPSYEMPDIDVEAPSLSPEEMVGEESVDADDASPLAGLTDPEASPFDDALLDAPAMVEKPAGPSWDDIVENCRGIAQARGAMLIDPAGQVFSARGDWPPPGPEAIAGKLVAMMAKTLKDAPTRSISAPLMGMHLTAWRVQLTEGLVTAAFIGTAAVRPDARPAIDAEITSGVQS